jgi:hypothetical protein
VGLFYLYDSKIQELGLVDDWKKYRYGVIRQLY